MEAKFLLLLFVLSTQQIDARIRKRLTPPTATNDTNRTSKNDSFHINVSAGYGVQQSVELQPLENSTTRPPFVPSQSYQFRAGNFEITEKTNVTKFAPSPTYQFIERTPPQPVESEENVKPQDNNQPQELLALRGNYYQVEEPISDSSNQQEVLNLARTYQFQPSYLHSRNRPSLNDLHKVVNNVEYDYQVGKPNPAKIVEIVRVPAVYELHLQDNHQEAQRFVSLNPWVTKLNGFNHNQKPTQIIRKPSYNYYQNQPQNYVDNNQYQIQNEIYQQHQTPQDYYQQIDDNNNYDNYYQQYQQPRPQYHQPQGELRSLSTILLMAAQQHQHQQQQHQYQQQRPHHYKHHYKQSKSKPKYKDYVRLPYPEGFKKIQEPASILDYTNYKKPQAIHEVPAPVLHNPHQGRIKPTRIPVEVYANQPTIETIPSNLIYEAQQEVQQQSIPGPLDNLLHLNPIQSSDNYQQNPGLIYKGQVESVPTDYTSYLESASNLIDSGKIVNLPQQLIQIDPHQQKIDNRYVVDSSNDRPDLVNYLVDNLAKTTPPTYLQGEIGGNNDEGVGNRLPQVFPMYQSNNQDGKVEDDSGEKSQGEEIYSQNISPDLMLMKAPQHYHRHQYRQQTEEDHHPVLPPRFESMKLRDDSTKSMSRNRPMIVNYPHRNGGNSRSRRHGPTDYIIFIKERTIE